MKHITPYKHIIKKSAFSLAFAGAIFLGPQSTMASPSVIEGPNIVSSHNEKFSLKGDKKTVVVFLSAKCPCSHSHLSELQQLEQKYSEKFQFVAIHSNADEPIELSKPYFSQAQLGFSVIEDSNQELANQLQAYKTPHAFIFLENGQKVYEGGVSDSHDCKKAKHLYLREALEDITANKAVRNSEGRTLGCVISRGKNSF